MSLSYKQLAHRYAPSNLVKPSILLGDAYEKKKTKNGEGNGTPLQYSCLENPMDGGA